MDRVDICDDWLIEMLKIVPPFANCAARLVVGRVWPSSPDRPRFGQGDVPPSTAVLCYRLAIHVSCELSNKGADVKWNKDTVQ